MPLFEQSAPLSSATPLAVGTAAPGASTSVSRDDHVHPADGDTPSTQAFNDSASEGTSDKAARSDHKHAMPTSAAGPDADVTIDAAGAAGTADTASRSGHGHKLSTYGSNPAALGTASAGTSTTAPSRGDHVHPTTGLVTTTLEVTGGGGDVTITDTYADLLSTTITGLAADNQIIVELDCLVNNNSGGTKTFTLALDLDGVLVEVSDGATVAASATNHAHMQFRGNVDIRATNLAYLHGSNFRFGPSAANTSTTLAGLTNARGAWNSTTNDLTGSTVVKVKIKSSAATATQTARVLGWRVRVI